MAKAKAKKRIRVEILKDGKSATCHKIENANRKEITITQAREIISANDLKQVDRIQSTNGILYKYANS